MNSVPDTIPIVVASAQDADSDSKSIFGRKGAAPQLREIPVATLRQNLQAVTEAALAVLQDARKVGRFSLKEVTIEVEISAEGGVALIGTASLGGRGAISLKFTE